jgi:hypothetical protein
LCQIQRTSYSFRSVICGPRHIQCIYSSAYAGFNIQLNVSALLSQLFRQFNALHTATMVPNAAHILQFTLSVLWSRTYKMNLQLHIFRLQFSTDSTCAAIGDMPTFGCALYCKFGAIYNAHPPVYAMWTAVPAICNVATAPHILESVFNWTYQRCYSWYLDNKMSVILQTLCQIQRTSSSFRSVICGPRHIQCIYSSAYSGFNIQLNVSALLSQLFRQFNALHTANVVPNIAHILQFTLCELWSRTYTV